MSGKGKKRKTGNPAPVKKEAMTHSEKVRYFLWDMQQRQARSAAASPSSPRPSKSSAYHFAPPLFQLLWRLGYEIPPPHFLSFQASFLVMGTPFGAVWGGLMWLLVWKDTGVHGVPTMLTVSLLAGILFGLGMATYYHFTAKKLNLPEWQDYPTASNRMQPRAK